MWIYDRQTLRFLEVSEGAIRLYGYTREEFLGMTVDEIGPIEDLTKLGHLDPGAVNGSHRWIHRRKDGTPVTLAINSNALLYDGQLARLVVAREVAESSAPESKPDSKLRLNPASKLESKPEPSPEPSSGPSPEPSPEPSPDLQLRADRDNRREAPSWISRELVEAGARLPDSRTQAASITLESRGLSDGASVAVEGVRQEDRRRVLEDRISLERKAREAMEYAERTRHRVAVVCLDLDNLEEVFDRFGADGAESCVEQVGLALTRRLRGMDTVARTGANTLTLVLAELDDDFMLHRVTQALLKVFARPFHVQGQPFVMSASIGVALYPDDGLDLTQLSRAAETAMQQARASGGHRIAMFSLEVRKRAELDAYMRETMQRGGFRLHYQPQYSPNGEISTLEALLRLPGKETGFISPDLFIPIAEDSGMIEQLGMWVIEQASRQVRAWHREYGRLAHVAVNVSPLQLRGHGFAERALSAIRSHGVVPASIEFEITERAVLNFDEVAEPMRKLSEAGIVFAVDDFGTGYSSLQHLHQLPISVIKIDRSFVQRMGAAQGAGAIIEAIVSMAHSLGIKVVAEGVETQAQRFAATEMGCDSIQGFLHTAAVDASRIPALMGWLN
jgi:diguanylate cyclase (GGDEF)-like protein/PAS domain S-box-containing protein